MAVPLTVILGSALIPPVATRLEKEVRMAPTMLRAAAKLRRSPVMVRKMSEIQGMRSSPLNREPMMSTSGARKLSTKKSTSSAAQSKKPRETAASTVPMVSMIDARSSFIVRILSITLIPASERVLTHGTFWRNAVALDASLSSLRSAESTADNIAPCITSNTLASTLSTTCSTYDAALLSPLTPGTDDKDGLNPDSRTSVANCREPASTLKPAVSPRFSRTSPTAPPRSCIVRRVNEGRIS
ncbi:hypothetical protein DFJ74DRAFT_664193, partial [Hyaloraphidium curvatum]